MGEGKKSQGGPIVLNLYKRGTSIHLLSLGQEGEKMEKEV